MSQSHSKTRSASFQSKTWPFKNSSRSIQHFSNPFRWFDDTAMFLVHFTITFRNNNSQIGQRVVLEIAPNHSNAAIQIIFFKKKKKKKKKKRKTSISIKFNNEQL